MCAMYFSKRIGAGCARSRIPDPLQIGGYVHHVLLMSQSELRFTTCRDPAPAQAPRYPGSGRHDYANTLAVEISPTHFSRLESLRRVYFVHASAMEAAHMHKKNRRPPCRKIVLKLPDLDHAKFAVLNSLSSPHSRRTSLQWSSSSPGIVPNRDLP